MCFPVKYLKYVFDRSRVNIYLSVDSRREVLNWKGNKVYPSYYEI